MILLCLEATLVLFIPCKAGYWSEVRINLHVLLMLFQEADRRPVPELIGEGRDEQAGLASHRGSETGGHSHSTGTHQQVLVMGAILGLRVGCRQDKRRIEVGASGVHKQARMNEKRQGDGGDRESRGRGRQGYGRSWLIHMPDITITLLIQ